MALRCGSRQTVALVTLLSGLVTLVLAWTLYAHADNTVTGWVANVSRVAPPLSACNASVTIARDLLDETTRSTLLALHFVLFVIFVLVVLVAFPSSLPSAVIQSPRAGVSLVWILGTCCSIFAVTATLRIYYGLEVVRDSAACDLTQAPPDSVIGNRPAVGTLVAFTVGNMLTVLFTTAWIWKGSVPKPTGNGYVRPAGGGNPFSADNGKPTTTQFSVVDSDDADGEEVNVPLT